MLLDVDCVLFHKLYADYVFFLQIEYIFCFYPAVTDELTSAYPSLL
jgi:hypothetical protein